MSNRKKALAIGGLVLGSFAILASTLLFLRPTYGDGHQLLKVRLVDIEKISVGTRVTFAGKPVGQVIKIAAVPDARLTPQGYSVYAYELSLEIDSGTRIYESDRIQPQTSGLMGEKSIAIIPQIAPSTGLVPIHQNDTLYSHISPTVEDTVQRAGQLMVKAEASIDLLYGMLKKGTGQVTTSLAQIQNASASLEKILNQIQDIHLVDELKETAHETSLAMSRINQSLEKFCTKENIENIDGILVHLNSVLKAVDDPAKVKDVLVQTQMAMSSLYHLGEKANQSWPKIDIAIDQMGQTTKYIEDLAAKGHHALDNVDKISTHVFEGKGTLGKLLMKDTTYFDINETIARTNVLLSDINNYGLFFTSNNTWKNQRIYRMDRLQSLKDPQAFNRYWQEQIQAMQINMGQLQEMMTLAKRVNKKEAVQKSPDFKKALCHVLESLGDLQEQLSLLTTEWTGPQETVPKETESQVSTSNGSHP